MPVRNLVRHVSFIFTFQLPFRSIHEMIVIDESESFLMFCSVYTSYIEGLKTINIAIYIIWSESVYLKSKAK